jgi:hypothetical protein
MAANGITAVESMTAAGGIMTKGIRRVASDGMMAVGNMGQ